MVPYGGRRDPRSRQGGQEPEQGQPAQVMEQDHRHHRPEQGPLFYTIVFCFAQMQAAQAAANITDKIATSAPTSQPAPPTVQPSVSGPMLLERKDRCYSSLLTANVAAGDGLVLGRYVIEDGGRKIDFVHFTFEMPQPAPQVPHAGARSLRWRPTSTCEDSGGQDCAPAYASASANSAHVPGARRRWLLLGDPQPHPTQAATICTSLD